MQMVISYLLGKAKRYLFLGLFFLNTLLAICVYAQPETYVTVYGMPQRTFVYNSMEKNHTDLSQYVTGYTFISEMRKYPTYSVAAGILFKHKINKRFFFCYGFQYSPVHQKWAIYDSLRSEYVPGNFLLTYMKLPLLIQYNYLVKEKFKLFISAGPQISMLLTAKGSVPFYSVGGLFDLYDPGSVYRNFTLDGALALGGEWRLYNNTFIFLQAKADYSFTNVEKKEFYELQGSHAIRSLFSYSTGKVRPPTHNISTGLSLGLTFKLR
jgi:hypothetical protein